MLPNSMRSFIADANRGKTMNGWMDWRAIEMQNDWGVREKTDAMGEMWNKDAGMWDIRWKNEEEFTRRQADALDLLPTDTVLDIGCGTGPLTMHIAPRVKKIIAQDYGSAMLELVRKNAVERRLDNVETLQGNWHDMEPGRDMPICDVAVARWSPAQGNILKMSRCARRYCYSLSTCSPSFAQNGFSTGDFGAGARPMIRSTPRRGPALASTDSTCTSICCTIMAPTRRCPT